MSEKYLSPNLEQTASYIIYTDGTTVYAKNGSTGEIDYSGTDAATVIQNASDNGHSIYIKSGKYILSDSFKPNNNTITWGDGSSTILKCADNTQKNVIEIIGTDTSQKHDILITNILIDGNKANNTWNAGGDTGLQCGIYTQYAIRVHIVNCEIQNTWSHGILFNINSNYGVVERCYLHDGNRSGVSIHDSSNDCIVKSNTIENFIENGMSGIVIHADCRNFRIINNNIINTWRGIYAFDTDYGIIEGNDVYNVYASSGIRLGDSSGSSNHNLVVDNHIDGAYTYGIEIYDGSYNLITRNKCHNVTGSSPQGITVLTGSYNRIYRNICYDDQRGIRLSSSSSNNYVKDNTLYNNSLYNLQDAGTNNTIKGNIGYTTENSGTAIFSGDGSTTSFNIEHELASTPTKIRVSPASPDAEGCYADPSDADATNIVVKFKTAPPSGTGNVKVSWEAEV